ncbi:MAG: DUF4430 domain-containing protein [Candidatus Hodarchaeota archaeon]
MKGIKNIAYFFAVLILIQLLFLSFTPTVKANREIANQYFQDLDLDKTYVYNVSQFGDPVSWYNFTPYPEDSFEGNWRTNPGGQIKINFTGFYNKDPNDWGNIFDDPIPWLDIEILEYNLSVLDTNFTLSNRSNSEVARALTLGYNMFQPGFLIPISNLTFVKQLALNQADPGGVYDIKGDVNVEETFNFFYVGFDQIGGEQKTYLIYDKQSGVLVWAKTSVFGYLLEIKCLNFTLNYASGFSYNVLQFGGAVGWYNFTPWPGDSYEGDWKSNIGGEIIVNFTGFYNKDPNDWGNVFDDPIAWFDIAIYENNSGILQTNFTLNNRSNSEIAWALTLGYNNFQPGILIPIIDNLTRVKQLAFQEAEGFVSGLVNIEESDLTIKIIFIQDGGGQETSLIYEKWTGLLLWTKTSVGSYLLEMTIDGYAPWELETESPPPSNFFLDFLPYFIIISISFIFVITTLIVSKVNNKIKEFNKYILVAIIAIASFSSFFVFSSSLEVGEVNKPQREVNDITLIVDYGNGTIKIIENFDLKDYNTTAFDALITWCNVDYHDYGDMGILVEEVDGVKGNWRYTVNDDFPGVSSDKYNLRDGDIVKWIYG